ncbi:M48 family metalloprotease [Saccharothrix australiensis]|uniref:Zn-dependent protease with chaperone function n=1 Tax=Saccharothrix australiensis TaxID=2072 RepID=A0A495VYT3_9PSEU|nr:M48 family metalloprotease [Saccharothrix australiensis]RKT54582.1 Zn-dependent protease with chaperone function [Saccharothrix australiensis]
MSAPAVDDRPRPVQAPAPDRPWWAYVLVWVALAVIGAGAGQALFTTLDLGDTVGTQVCLVRNGISVDGADPVTTDQSVYGSCVRDYFRVQATAVLAGAVALPVAAWLLMLLGGVGTRWRLRPGAVAGMPAGAERLTGRFAELCDSQGLTGRHRPRLVLAPPGTGVAQAFTTGLPGSRPWVVVPLSYAYADPAAFDAVAAHELGHVRSRDVLWASAVWWAGWLAVPALLLALVPLAGTPAVAWDAYRGALVVAVAVAVAMFVLRAGLLRRRELAADRHVVEVLADPNAVAALVRPSGKRRAGVFATHPTAGDRLAAGLATRHPEGGFVVTVAVGVVAMAAHHVAFSVLSSLRWTFDADVTASAPVVAAVLWSSVVVPLWTRRAPVTPGRWTGPLAGAVVGLVVGYLLQPPGVITVLAATPGRGLLLVLLLLPGLVLAAFAAALLAAGLAARLTVHSGHPRLRRFGAVLAVTSALSALWGTVIAATTAHVVTEGVGSIRWFLVVNGDDRVWRYAAALVLVGLVLAVLRTRPGRPALAVSAVAAVTGGVAAALSWQLRSGGGLSDARSDFLTHQGWWICALAGLVAVAAVVVVNGGAPAEVPIAVLCGLTVTVSAGAVQYAAVWIGSGVRSDFFRESLRMPGWLLLLALAGAAPLIAAVVAVTRRREPRGGAVRWAAGAGGVTALLSLLLVAGGLSSVTVVEGDLARPDARSRPTSTEAAPPSSPPEASVEPERPLDQQAATTALSDVPGVLPPGAKSAPDAAETSSTLVPDTCDAAAKRTAANKKALPRAAEAEQRFTFPLGDAPDGGTISVSVTSHPAAPPGFSDLDAENEACARFRLPSERQDDGYLDCRITARPAHDFPLARKRNVTAQGRIKGVPMVVVVHDYAATFGLNRVEVSLSWFYLTAAPPQAVLDEADRIATSAMNVIAARL